MTSWSMLSLRDVNLTVNAVGEMSDDELLERIRDLDREIAPQLKVGPKVH